MSPPLPAIRASSSVWRRCPAARFRRCSTMRSTTGRSSSTAALASSSVKVRSIVGLSSSPVTVRQRRRETEARTDLRIEQAPPPALGIYFWSRAVIWLGAIFAFYWFEPNRNPRAGIWDSPLIHDLGSFTDVWARWDSVFFVRIAEHGYGKASAAFYPLYPGLVAAFGRAFFGHYVVAGIVVSLTAALFAFVLLYRIAEEHLGAQG